MTKAQEFPRQSFTRVCEPFYRVEESRSRETGGVGLGLAITQSIVQAHGGTLTLSNRPTGGLRASIALPLQSEVLPLDLPEMRTFI